MTVSVCVWGVFAEGEASASKGKDDIKTIESVPRAVHKPDRCIYKYLHINIYVVYV